MSKRDIEKIRVKIVPTTDEFCFMRGR